MYNVIVTDNVVLVIARAPREPSVLTQTFPALRKSFHRSALGGARSSVSLRGLAPRPQIPPSLPYEGRNVSEKNFMDPSSSDGSPRPPHPPLCEVTPEDSDGSCFGAPAPPQNMDPPGLQGVTSLRNPSGDLPSGLFWGGKTPPKTPPQPPQLIAGRYWGGSAHYPDPTAQSAHRRSRPK